MNLAIKTLSDVLKAFEALRENEAFKKETFQRDKVTVEEYIADYKRAIEVLSRYYPTEKPKN